MEELGFSVNPQLQSVLSSNIASNSCHRERVPLTEKTEEAASAAGQSICREQVVQSEAAIRRSEGFDFIDRELSVAGPQVCAVCGYSTAGFVITSRAFNFY